MKIQLKPIDQQRIVITGASSGIGLAAVRMAARKGAKVLLAARDETALRRISDELNNSGADTAFLATDVSIEAEVEALASFAVERFGGFDTWVNDAGVGIVGRVEDTSTDDHHRIFETNYFGMVYGSLAAVRHFRRNGRSGALINLGSTVSDIPIAMSVAYGATKHAVKGFTEGLRIELMREKLPVSVTLIKPSGIDTPFFEHALTMHPGIGRAPGPIYDPDVVANAILFAAQHRKRDISVGATAAIGGLIEGLAPGSIDRMQASMPITDLIDFGEEPSAASVRNVPVEGEMRSHSRTGRRFSVSTGAQTQGRALAPLAIAAGVAALAILASGPRSRP